VRVVSTLRRMISTSLAGLPALASGLALTLYVLAAAPGARWQRGAALALLLAFAVHGLLLLLDIGGVGSATGGARLGFGPVLSMTVWLVIAVYSVESRLVPLPAVRLWLAWAGVAAVVVGAVFPGDVVRLSSALAPLHFALGVGSYGLFGAAVLHGVMLDATERRLRSGGLGAAAGVPPSTAPRAMGMPLLQLERLTFRFVEAGFVVLTATLALGILSTAHWRWGDHKAVFSVMAWAVFAALIVGRRLRGWRGRRATRWLYGGAALLLLAYVGSRFVLEVLLGR
jgi:ABC-type uncharacterized transport system permease subunit